MDSEVKLHVRKYLSVENLPFFCYVYYLMSVLLGTNVLNFSESIVTSFYPLFKIFKFLFLLLELGNGIQRFDLQVPEQALLLYDCWCFFFFWYNCFS